MVKVLMVCLGNICRSPLAEGILKSKVNVSEILVDSAGTAAYHIGKGPDSRSVKVASDHGIDISSQRARQFVSADFEKFDFIYVMDQANYDDVVSLASTNKEKNKVELILNEISPEMNSEVPDPYYGGDGGFKNVYDMLNVACDIINKKLSI